MSQDWDFEVGLDIIATQLQANGTVTAQLGSAALESSHGSHAEVYGVIGLVSRPAKAQAGKNAAQAIVLKGNRDAIVASRDLRGQEIYGNLEEGDTCIYAPGPDGAGQTKVVLKGDGAVTISVTDDNSHNGFTSYMRFDRTGFALQFPFAQFVIDQTGMRFMHTNGAVIEAGAVNLGPGPLQALSSYITLQAASVTCDAPVVTLGPSPLQGGLGYMQAAFGMVPSVAALTPMLGVGVGAVTVAAANSTKVLIGI